MKTDKKIVTGYIVLDPRLYAIGKAYTCEPTDAKKFRFTLDCTLIGYLYHYFCYYHEDFCGFDCFYLIEVNTDDFNHDKYNAGVNIATKIKIIGRLTVDDVIALNFAAAKNRKFSAITGTHTTKAYSKSRKKLTAIADGHLNLATSGRKSTVVIGNEDRSIASKQYAASGDGTSVFSTAKRSEISISGMCGFVAASGYRSAMSSSSMACSLAATGDYARIAATGRTSQLTCEGNYGRVVAVDDYSSCSATGENNVIVIVGQYSRFKGVKGTPVSAANYDKSGKCIGFVSGCIGKDGLKENIVYTVRDGQFVEVREDER
ncbi:MAG: hypothetical protein [Bacteriophage sp.]|nr:MAG: hypothetical protein [Bacteriophage sp.]